jgi:hypothetical protein
VDWINLAQDREQWWALKCKTAEGDKVVQTDLQADTKRYAFR